MSTLKVDALQAKTTNGTLTLTNNGTGKVELPADATIGGVAMTTTFASGATAAEKSNIMLNSFRIEEQGGLTVQGMVDGVSDVFTDESGVDTATSTDETYNATGDYYENPASVTTLSASGEWNGATLTFTGNGISGTSGDKAIRTNDSFTGDFSVTWTSPSFDGAWTVGTCGTSLDGSFNSASYHGGVFYGTVVSPAISVRNNTATTLDMYANGTLLATIAYALNDVLIFARVGSTFTLTKNGALAYTWAYTSSAEMRLLFCKNSVVSVQNFSWTIPATVVNSVIVSDTFTALSQPDTAFVAIWHEDVDSVTLNTDFTIEVSRDAGTTWTAGTLALATTLGADKIITCTIDISGQPAGTSIEYRAKFLNEKSQRLRGVAMQWS
jgi:hypothetical protein